MAGTLLKLYGSKTSNIELIFKDQSKYVNLIDFNRLVGVKRIQVNWKLNSAKL